MDSALSSCLYVLGVVLVLSASQKQEATLKVVFEIEAVMEALNVLTKVTLVGVLNYVQVRNVARSRFKYRLLKGTLIVICLSQMCTLIGAIMNVFRSFLLPIATGENPLQQEGSFPYDLSQFFLLPILTRTAELIFTKILQDNKCIIGKNKNNVRDESDESSSFTRQRDPRDSNANETNI